MARSTATILPEMGRPPSEKPKTAILHLRVHPEIRDAVERLAQEEKRTLANTADVLLREAIIARMKERGEDTADIEALP